MPWRTRAVGQDAERLARAAATGAPWDLRAPGGAEGDGRRGYATQTRIFHPLTDGEGRRTSWKQRAAGAGVEYGPGLRGLDFLLQADGWGAGEGDLGRNPAGDVARAALTHVLLAVVGRDTSADFFYGTGAVMAGHQPTVFRAPLTDLGALHESFVDASGGPVAGPELWWPQDRSWLVETNYASTYSDVFGHRALADLLETNPELETLPITTTPPAPS